MGASQFTTEAASRRERAVTWTKSAPMTGGAAAGAGARGLGECVERCAGGGCHAAGQVGGYYGSDRDEDFMLNPALGGGGYGEPENGPRLHAEIMAIIPRFPRRAASVIPPLQIQTPLEKFARFSRCAI
jgi:hypothetical protein